MVGLSCPGMPCVAHAPHYRRERRSRVRRGDLMGDSRRIMILVLRFKEILRKAFNGRLHLNG